MYITVYSITYNPVAITIKYVFQTSEKIYQEQQCYYLIDRCKLRQGESTYLVLVILINNAIQLVWKFDIPK